MTLLLDSVLKPTSYTELLNLDTNTTNLAPHAIKRQPRMNELVNHYHHPLLFSLHKFSASRQKTNKRYNNSYKKRKREIKRKKEAATKEVIYTYNAYTSKTRTQSNLKMSIMSG